MTESLSRDQFLPGMEGLRPAEPWEQTESQFLNRPDVFFHGRFEDRAAPASKGPTPRDWQFHAGSEKAAIERMTQLGHRWNDRYEPRFYAGRVDPSQMHNQPPPEGPNFHPGQRVEERGVEPYKEKRVVREADNEWRAEDIGEDWSQSDVDHYYRNDYEDVGSTSVILKEGREGPRNFRTHRSLVSEAIRDGLPVPKHVQATFEASGGTRGSRAIYPQEYQHPSPKETEAQYAKREAEGRPVPKYAKDDRVVPLSQNIPDNRIQDSGSRIAWNQKYGGPKKFVGMSPQQSKAIGYGMDPKGIVPMNLDSITPPF